MPKVWTFNDEAKAADLNLLIADRPREYHLVGGGVKSGRKIETTATSEPGTPDMTIPIGVILGTYLIHSFTLKADSGGTCHVKAKLKIGATVDDLFTETTAGIRDEFQAIDITGLANNGDVRGKLGVIIEVFVWKTGGGIDAEYSPDFLKSGEFNLEADNFWFPLNTDA